MLPYRAESIAGGQLHWQVSCSLVASEVDGVEVTHRHVSEALQPITARSFPILHHRLDRALDYTDGRLNGVDVNHRLSRVTAPVFGSVADELTCP